MSTIKEFISKSVDSINTIAITDPIGESFLTEICEDYLRIKSNPVKNRGLQVFSQYSKKSLFTPNLPNHTLINAMETDKGFIMTYRNMINFQTVSLEFYW